MIKNIPEYKNIYSINLSNTNLKVNIKLNINLDELNKFYKKNNYIPEKKKLIKIIKNNYKNLHQDLLANVTEHLIIQNIFRFTINFNIIQNIKWMSNIENSIIIPHLCSKKTNIINFLKLLNNDKKKLKEWIYDYKGGFIVGKFIDNIIISILAYIEFKSVNTNNIIITKNQKLWNNYITKIKNKKNYYTVVSPEHKYVKNIDKCFIKRIIFGFEIKEDVIKSYEKYNIMKWICLLEKNRYKIFKFVQFILRNKNNKLAEALCQYFVVKYDKPTYNIKSAIKYIKNKDISPDFFKNYIYSDDKLIYLNNLSNFYRLRFIYLKSNPEQSNSFFIKNLNKLHNEDCIICLQKYHKLIFECGHIFCIPCILKLLKSSKKIKCPSCRKKINKIYPLKNNNIKFNSLLLELVKICNKNVIIVSNFNFVIKYFRNISLFKNIYFLSIKDILYNSFDICKLQKYTSLIFLEPFLIYGDYILDKKQTEKIISNIHPNISFTYYSSSVCI